jgi:tRNA dimethylallyltransferase
MSDKEPIITVLGPTATGKTSVAVRIAADLGGEIVSADSRQVFRRMDIGSGKDLSEYQYNGQPIPYHLIDIEEPGVEYNVFRYQQTAYEAMEGIRSRGHRIVLCGGSGMYVEAVLRGYRLFPVPENELLRKELEQHTDEELTEMLASYKSLHNDTDTSERPRLIRAIEIEDYYAKHPELSERVRPLQSAIIGLCGNRDHIRERITRRLQARLQEGMVDEVKALLDEGVPAERLIRYGLEYKFVTQYLLGELHYGDMVSLLNTAIHQFSKRQMTWFRRMERMGFKIRWVDAELPEEEKFRQIYHWLREDGIQI